MRGLYTLRKYVIMHLSMYRPTYWQRWGVWSIEWDIFFPHKMSQAFTGILQITGWKLSGDIYNNFVHNIGLMGQGLNCLNLVNPPPLPLDHDWSPWFLCWDWCCCHWRHTQRAVSGSHSTEGVAIVCQLWHCWSCVAGERADGVSYQLMATSAHCSSCWMH